MFPKLAVLVSLLPALALAQPPASEVAVEAEPHHHVVLENAQVRVLKVEVAPHSETLMHRHEHDYFFVTLGPAEIENDVAGKPPVPLKLQDGEVRFTPGGFAHVAKTLGDTPFRNLTIEILQPGATFGGDAGTPRELPGATIAPLLLKDGVRVSDVRLKAGGTIPRHHHDGPHLVVAVTDLDLRSETEGQPAAARALKAGEVAWIPGGITHAITNAGAAEARMITLEFPASR
jgi:quercetin dioxygenase-like cupin family protein